MLLFDDIIGNVWYCLNGLYNGRPCILCIVIENVSEYVFAVDIVWIFDDKLFEFVSCEFDLIKSKRFSIIESFKCCC